MGDIKVYLSDCIFDLSSLHHVVPQGEGCLIYLSVPEESRLHAIKTADPMLSVQTAVGHTEPATHGD